MGFLYEKRKGKGRRRARTIGIYTSYKKAQEKKAILQPILWTIGKGRIWKRLDIFVNIPYNIVRLGFNPKNLQRENYGESN